MKVLIVKSSALGDIIQAFQILAPLKKQFPGCQIDWVVEAPFKDIVEAHPLIDHAILIETRKWRKLKSLKTLKETVIKLRSTPYDFVIDLQGNIKSGLITWLSKGKKGGYGWKTAPEKVNTFFTNIHVNPEPGHNQREDYFEIVKKTIGFEAPILFEELPMKPIKNIMVCPGSAWPNKQLTNECLKDFLSRLSVHGFHFHMVWGSPAEKATCELIAKEVPNTVIVDRRPIPELAKRMKEMDLVIAMDSMALHLAGDLQVPTFSLFGPSNAERYKPLGKNAFTFQGACPYGRTFERRCPLMRTCETGACLRSESGETLYNSFVKQTSI